MENITVAIRMRPKNKREKGEETPIFIDKDSVKVGSSHTFTFDRVFGPETTQENVYNSIGKNAVDWVGQGYNATIFVYGATSSGKSHTMFGTETDLGIIPRTCRDVYTYIEQNENVVEASVKCSFIEIYLEHLRDLLKTSGSSCDLRSRIERSSSTLRESDGSSCDLKIRHSDVRGTYIQGVKEVYVYSPEEIIALIKEGSMYRITASTSLNNTSSRSHAVLTLTVMQKYTDGSETLSKLHLIDLAGSENVGRSEVQGIGLLEAQMINKSLSSLGNVISALTEPERLHIPYRDSKLTFLLQDSLGGNSKTILISTISPAESSISETINTLKFAKRAKEIQNKPVLNKNESVSVLLKTIDVLKDRIVQLESGRELERKIESSPENGKVKVLEDIVKNLWENEPLKKVTILLEKQRGLTENISEKLYDLQLKNFQLSKELEILRFFFNSVKGAPNVVIKNRVEEFSKLLSHDI